MEELGDSIWNEGAGTKFRKVELARPGWWHTYDALLDSLVGQGTCALDLGCGWRHESHLRKYEGWATCVGVDVDTNLHKQVLHLKTLADAHYLPFEDGVFDVISSVYVLEHIEKPPQYFREAARVLRRGGALLLITNSYYNPVAWAGKLLPQRWHQPFMRDVLHKQVDYDNAPLFYRANTRRLLLQYCRDAGFSSCRIIHLSGMYEYFRHSSVVGRVILALGNLLTDNSILAFLKLNLVLIANKSNAEEGS